jgi:aspartyl/glutamyl-tRNA(Asn/Gln) amidotransferase C subunit
MRRANWNEPGGKRVSEERRVSPDNIQTISELARLPLTEARTEQLVRTLSGFLEKFERMNEIDVQDAEPPTITYETEVQP